MCPWYEECELRNTDECKACQESQEDLNFDEFWEEFEMEI